MCKIISIANQKGGVGKTTTAMNLGVALELQGKHTLLIDFDPQASLSSYLGFINDNGDNIDELPTINNLMMSAIGMERKSEDIMSYIRHSKVNNIDYIPSDLNLANADCYLSGVISRETVLKRMLTKELIGNYDYIIIDCLPSLGVLLMNALVASDGFIIPVQTQKFAFDGLVMLENVFGQIKNTVNNKLELIGVLATMYETNATASKVVLEKLKQRYPDKLFATYIHKATEAEKSTNKQKSLCLYNNRPGEEYKAVAKEVIEVFWTFDIQKDVNEDSELKIGSLSLVNK